jgi:hypothetical protein
MTFYLVLFYFSFLGIITALFPKIFDKYDTYLQLERGNSLKKR